MGFMGFDLIYSALIRRYSLPSPIGKRGESGEIKEPSEVGVVMAKVRCKAVYADIFMAVVSFDRYELPFFAVHDERIFKGSKADKFKDFHGI
jgi:hypothetical protein